jgi:hypothetical protein
MIIWLITLCILFFFFYWTSKKTTKHHQHYDNLMSDYWKIKYILQERERRATQIDSELQPKHRVCLTCMNRNKKLI